MLNSSFGEKSLPEFFIELIFAAKGLVFIVIPDEFDITEFCLKPKMKINRHTAADNANSRIAKK